MEKLFWVVIIAVLIWATQIVEDVKAYLCFPKTRNLINKEKAGMAIMLFWFLFKKYSEL